MPSHQNLLQRRGRLAAALLGTLLLAVSGVAVAAPLNLVVQPVLPAARIAEAYEPLASYLTKRIGQPVRIVTAENFVGYWEAMKRGDQYDLILDAAHFTDFRRERMDYEVLAKLPDTVSYSLVTGGDLLLFDAGELVGKSVATLPSPSLGAVRLAELFPNPLRQPVVRSVNDSIAAIEMVLNGKAAAAIVPTPLLNAYPSLNVVTTTAPVPHMAMSAAPGVAPELRAAIRQALVEASETAQGRQMLEALRVPGFVSAAPDVYEGYGQLLEGVWGY